MPHRRKINWFGILFWLLIIVIFTASVLLVISYRKNKSPETPSVEIGDTSMSDDHADTQDETAGTDTKLPTGTVTDDTAQDTEEDDSKPEEEEKQEEEKSEEEEKEETKEEEKQEAEEETTQDEQSSEEETSAPPPVAGVDNPGDYSGTAELVVAYAKSAIDVPYEFGGSGPNTFDTSGLISYCFGECGITVPRRVSEQAEFGTEVSRENLQPGDVVFFYFDNEGEAEYVGIYIGGDTFIAARSTKGTVGEIYMGSDYYAERFVCARRYY